MLFYLVEIIINRSSGGGSLAERDTEKQEPDRPTRVCTEDLLFPWFGFLKGDGSIAAGFRISAAQTERQKQTAAGM